MLFLKKKLIAIFLVLVFCISIFLSFSSFSNGQEATSDLQNKINDLKNKISSLQSQAKTLSSQIAIMDSQIKLTEARIEANKKEIVELTLDIDTTTKKISSLQAYLDSLSEILIKRIIATYISGSATPWETFLSSKSAPDLLLKYNYLKVIQAHDKKLVYETQQAKNDYSNQKEIFEEKRRKIEELKKQLEQYNVQLAQEKKDKNALFVATKNDEKVYQQQLQAALAEQAAIAKITAGGGNAVFAGKVKEGDLIGYVITGRSACSSGTHLHFEVFKNGGLQDPSGYLSNKSVIFNNEPDGQFSFGGSWRWPLDDPIKINQGYGMTSYSRLYYGGGPHTGIDMSSNSSSSVYAVKDGDLFKGSISCGGGQLLFSKVEQSDNIQTYYLHMASSL